VAVTAEIVKDSISPDGIRLITIAGECHRFIWSQILTHQNGLVRNSASSRAVPVNKNIQKVLNDPAIPLFWGKAKTGMQAAEEVDNPGLALVLWLEARDRAVQSAKSMLDIGLAKELANRVLEPYLWHKVAITGTQQGWDSFFRLRVHHAPQREVQAFAQACKDAIDNSKVLEYVDYKSWHLPFVDNLDGFDDIDLAKRCSTSRTARVSYENHFGVRDVSSDEKLFSLLFNEKPEHASPGAHICTPCRGHFTEKRGTAHLGGLVGWDQFRHEIECGYDYS
jgi:hypothetical protein